MKYILVLTLINLCGISNAQSPFPAGLANTYTLTEKEGYNGFIYSSIEFAPDGTVYTGDYAGNLEIHGNNYSIKSDTLKTLGNIMGFKVIDNNEVWAIGLKYIAVIKNKKIERIIALPENTFGVGKETNMGGAYVFSSISGTVKTWFFDGKELRALASTNLVYDINQGGVFETTANEILLLKRQNDSLLIYKFDKVTASFNFKKSYVNIYWIWKIIDENNFFATSLKKNDCVVKNGIATPLNVTINNSANNSYNFSSNTSMTGLYKIGGNRYCIAAADSSLNLKQKTAFIHHFIFIAC